MRVSVSVRGNLKNRSETLFEQPSSTYVWPKAMVTVAWGSAPGIEGIGQFFG